MTWLYTMKQNSNVGQIFQQFYRMIGNQFSLNIKVLISDNGGEYHNSELSQFFMEHGILHETTCPKTPRQNGVAEHKNRHILETTRALLIRAQAPNTYWADVVTYSVYLLNRMQSRIHNFRTPMEVLTKSCFSSIPLTVITLHFWMCGVCASSQKTTQ